MEKTRLCIENWITSTGQESLVRVYVVEERQKAVHIRVVL